MNYILNRVVLMFLAAAGTAGALTKMGDLAVGMNAGEWAELVTGDFGNNDNTGKNDLLEDYGGHHILQYTDEAHWDPVNREFLFLGQGHSSNWDDNSATNSRFIRYSDATNRWDTLPDIPSNESNIGHAYDHSAIDPAGRAFFHRPYGSTTVYQYAIDAQTWSTLPRITTSIMEYNNCCVGIDYFPEMQSLVYASLESGTSGSVIRWSNTTNQWSRVGQGKNLPIGSYHHFTEYNPVHKVLIFGGGNGSSDVHKLDSTGNITTLANGPVNIGINSTLLTTDPVTGQHLLFTNDETFYVFDIPTNTWTLQDRSKPPIFNNSDGGSSGIVAAPVSTYGIIMFLYWAGDNSAVYLYKHAHDLPTAVPVVKSDRGPAFKPRSSGGKLIFSFSLATRQDVRIQLYSASGAYAGAAASGLFDRGAHTVCWRPEAGGSGMYAAVINIGEDEAVIKTVRLSR